MRSALVVLMLYAVTLTGTPAASAPETMDAMQLHAYWGVLWNENKLDELGEVFYAEDALMVPPNHEPIRGRQAIVEFLKGARPVMGEAQEGSGTDPFLVARDGELTSIVGKLFFGPGGNVRFSTHELYRRQADGTVKCIVDMFGFRDPLR